MASGDWSQYKIVKTFAISSKTVSSIANGTYSPSKVGAKPKFTQQHIDCIVEIAFLYPRLQSMAQKFKEKFSHLSISVGKVSEIIKEHGFRYLSARKVQDLNTVQIVLSTEYYY